MALKDLLVYADQNEGARFRLRLAADLASRHKSRLTVLFVREFNQAQRDLRKKAELGLVSGEDLDRLDQHIQSSIDEAADRLRSTVQALGSEHHLEVEWRCVDGPAWVSAPQHARYADLCILGLEQSGRWRIHWICPFSEATVRHRTACGVRPFFWIVGNARASHNGWLE